MTQIQENFFKFGLYSDSFLVLGILKCPLINHLFLKLKEHRINYKVNKKGSAFDQSQKASANSWAFSLDLKLATVGVHLMSSGSWFQSFAAASPCLILTEGITNKFLSSNLRDLTECYTAGNISER